MSQRALGPFTVSALGLGCMGMSHGYGDADADESAAVLHRALDLGCTLLDTAALYGFGRNESLLGETLHERRQDFVLTSKCGMFKNDAGQRTIDGRPSTLRQTCEDSLRRLRTDVIDLYYLHRVDPQVPLADSIGTLAELVAEGKIRTIGLSEVSAETLRQAHAIHPITALQSEYALWSRNVEIKVLTTCQELGIAFVAFSPLGRGFMTGHLGNSPSFAENDIRRNLPRFNPENFELNQNLLEYLVELATAQSCTPAQLALAWVLTRGEHVFAIPGTTRLPHLEENLGATSVTLTTETVQRLDEVFSPDAIAGPRYPASTQKEIGTEEFPGSA